MAPCNPSAELSDVSDGGSTDVGDAVGGDDAGLCGGSDGVVDTADEERPDLDTDIERTFDSRTEVPTCSNPHQIPHSRMLCRIPIFKSTSNPTVACCMVGPFPLVLFIFSVRRVVCVRPAVMSATMLDAVLELDVWGKERVEGGRRG